MKAKFLLYMLAADVTRRLIKTQPRGEPRTCWQAMLTPSVCAVPVWSARRWQWMAFFYGSPLHIDNLIAVFATKAVALEVARQIEHEVLSEATRTVTHN